VIWSCPVSDKVTLEITALLKPLKGYREEAEFTVRQVTAGGGRKAVCKVGEDGLPKVWYVFGEEREVVQKAIKDLPNTLLVELVSQS